jgi:hypothetical protein
MRSPVQPHLQLYAGETVLDPKRSFTFLNTGRLRCKADRRTSTLPETLLRHMGYEGVGRVIT